MVRKYKSGVVKTILTALISGLMVSVSGIAPASATTAVPFTCSPNFYQVSSTGSGALYESSINASGQLVFTKTLGTAVSNMNAIGYNTADNFIYGVVGSTLYQIDAGGNERSVGTITGATTGSPGSGDFIAPNKLQVINTATSMSIVDITTRVATAVTILTPSGTTGPIVGAWDFTAKGNYAYGINGGTLIRLDLTSVLAGTGTVETATSYTINAGTTTGPNTGAVPPSGSYGAAYSDLAGNIYFFNNGTAMAYQISASSLASNPPAPKSLLMGGKAATPALAGPNDGASCPKAASAYAPIVQTTNPSSVTQNSAVLNGTVNPQTAGTSENTTATFIYNTTGAVDANGNLTGTSSVNATPNTIGSSPGNTVNSINYTLNSLAPGTTYYYQAVGANSSGTSYGVVKSFSTAGVLTYDGNGATNGTVPPSVTASGVTVLALNPGNLQKTGYKFWGWAEANNATDSVTSVTVSGNKTVYAVWKTASFTISYDSNTANGGSNVAATTTSGSASLPSNTWTKSGFVFGGWNTAPNGSGTQYSPGQTITVTGNLTLYAIWIPAAASYTLHYVGNGSETGTVPADQTGETLTISASSLQKTGFTFAGWTDNGNLYAAGDQIVLTQNETMTANWLTTVYTLTYAENGATSGVPPANVVSSGTIGVDGNIGLLARTGYTFSGWTLSPNVGPALSTINLSSSQTLYALWTPITLTLTFNVNGGSGSVPAAQTALYGAAPINITTDTGTISNGSNIFAGWNTKADGTGITYTPGDPFELTANTTLYAKWVAVVYTLTYNSQGATSTPASVQGNGVLVLESQGSMTKGSLLFDGWNTKADGTGVTYAGGDNFDLRGNTTLYAVWSTAQYTLTYDPNTADGGNVPPSSVGNGDVVVASNDYGLTKGGKVFGGWNTKADGSGFTFPGGSSINLEANTTLYAIWVDQLFTLHFDSNTAGAVGQTVTGFTPDDETGTGLIILPGNDGNLAAPTYSFGGWWNTRQDGTGITYAPGDGFILSANTTLYAKWLQNPFTITFNGNGNDGGVVPDPIQGRGIIVLPYNSGTLTKTGFTFGGWNGWNTSPDGSGITYMPGDYYDLRQNVTLYAMWDDITYTLSFLGNGSTSGTVPQPIVGYGDISLPGNIGGLVNTSNPNFLGWSADGNPAHVFYGPGDVFALDTDTVLKAVWTSAAIVTLSYDGNGATGGFVPDTQTAAVGDIVNTASNDYGLVRTGYYFVGWTDSPTVNTYFPGDPITLSAATVLYAQWAALQYTITYDINNGDTGTVPNSQSGYGTVTISSNSGGLGLTGQNFVGWNDQSDGNGNSYTPGASYALTSQNVYLYAIYAAPTPPAPPSNNPPAVTPTPEPKVETPTATGPTQPKLPAPIPVSPNQFVGKIATTAAPKQVVPNQIVPVKQKIEVQAPVESTIKEVLVNGKVVNATIAPTGEITLPVLVGPKDKIVVEEVAAGQTVEVPVVEANSPISLANVNFDFESANLTAAAKKILDKVVAVVKQHGFTSIDLSGHTDVLASGGFDNQLLSEHRAAAVRAYIKSKLAGSHVSIIIEGKAANEQLINKADAASRAVNRRVEIIVK